MKLVFFGTSDFSTKILDFLLKQDVEVCAIVTRPDMPKGRSQKLQPSPVKKYAREASLKIPILDPIKASTPEIAQTLKSFAPDVFIVVSYGEIIKQNLLDIPRLYPINIHTSLLPKYRGAAPIQRALMDGETETGVTIMEMVLELDAGDILDVEKVPILENMIFPELENALISASYLALKRVISHLKEGIKKIPQDSSFATYAKKILSSECQIDWHKDAQVLHNLVRGVSPKPGAWCMITLNNQQKRLKVLRSQIKSLQGVPGEILLYDQEGFIVACGKNSLLLEEVQLEGKKSMKYVNFVRGFPKPLL